MTGKHLSEKHRENIGKSQRGITRSAEFKAKVSAGMKAFFAHKKMLESFERKYA